MSALVLPSPADRSCLYRRRPSFRAAGRQRRCALVAAGAVLCGLLLTAGAAGAGQNNRVPLTPLPADKVRELAPLLRSSDLAVLESDAAGRQKQVSIFSLIAAPPELVRDVLLQAERYPEFVRNLRSAKVKGASEAGFDLSFVLSYGLFSVEASDRYVKLPADPQADAPPVEIYDLSESEAGTTRYRWEFYRVAGATVLAQYGYTEILHSGGLVRRLVDRVPQLEHGLALASQAALLLAMKARAEQLNGPPPLMPPAGPAPYDALLERGTVVLLRSSAGRLAETSLIERSTAPASELLQVVRHPTDWPRFVPTLAEVNDRANDRGDRDDLGHFDLVQELPLLSFKTRYASRFVAGAVTSSVDMLGQSGDLSGGRLRFDVTPVQGKAATSQIVLRAVQQYDKASLIIRQLYRLEPLFEYGVNVGLQLLLLRSLRQHAEAGAR